MPQDYPKWDIANTPHTRRRAAPTRWRSVSGVPAIRVSGATYRGCLPIDGVFEVVDSTPQRVNKKDRYEVYCAWFGVKPPTKFPRLHVVGEIEYLPNYSGPVIDNISDGPFEA